MRSQSNSFRERSLTFAKLQKEVRATTERVHGRALRRSSNGNADYLAHVSVLLDELIDHADAHGQVICFASAAEFGLSLRHQGERCRQAAVNTGSDSIMVLYWAAVRRMYKQGGEAAKKPGLNSLSSDSFVGIAASVDCTTGMGGADATWSAVALCRLCESLQVDSRCAHGHDALHPTSGKFFRSLGESSLAEAQVYQCSACKAIWTQYKHRSDPFAMWSVRKRQ